MFDKLGKFLRIRTGEGRKVLEFAAIAALLQAGLAIGLSAADALFLQHVGAQKLTHIYLIVPFMMLAFVPLSAYGISKFNLQRFFTICLFTMAAGCLFIFAALKLFPVHFPSGVLYLYYFIKLFSELWMIILFTLLWNYIDEYFNIMDAKRLFSFFSGGMALGTLVGGGLVMIAITILPVQFLFLLWLFLAIITYIVIRAVSKKWPKIDSEEIDRDILLQKSDSTFKIVWGAIKTSAFVPAFSITIFSILVLTTLCEFQTMQVFEEGRDSASLAALFGKLYIVVSVFTLVVNFIFFNRLVILMGVRNVALIQPLAYVVAFSFFILSYGFSAAVFGFFIYQGILTSIEFNNQNFLFNALPTKGKAILRTLIEGLCEPLATAFTGLFLFLFISHMLPETLSVVGLGVAVAGFCIAAWLRNEYGKAMVDKLRSSWLDFSGNSRQIFEIPNPEELDVLRLAAKSRERCKVIPAIERLWLHNRAQALEALLQFLDIGSVEDQTAATPQLAKMLKEEDVQIFSQVLAWVRSTRASLASGIIQELSHYNLIDFEDASHIMPSSSPEAKAAASIALWQSWQLEANVQGVNNIRDLINGNQEERIAGIRSLGKLSQPRYIKLLTKFLKDPSPPIRKQALMSLLELINEETEELNDDLLSVIRDGDRIDRLIVLDALARIKNTDSIRALMIVSHLLSPFERRKVQSLIQDIGLQGVPILVTILRGCDFHYYAKSLVARSLGNLAFPQFESISQQLVEDELDRAFNWLCAQWLFSTEYAIGSLASFFSRLCKETAVTVTEFILELLSIGGRLPDFELLASSLRSSNTKDRADAIEAIEQGCSRRISARLLPLLDGRELKDIIHFYHHVLGHPMPSQWDIIINSISSPFQEAGAAAIQLCVEKGVFSGNAPKKETNQILEAMKHKLLDPETDLISEVIFSVFKSSRLQEETVSYNYNRIEKTQHICNCKFFSNFAIREIELLAKNSHIKALLPGQALYTEGSSHDHIYVLVEGIVRLSKGGHEQTIAIAPMALGTEILFGENCWATAVSMGATAIVISRASILETAEIRPAFTINLLACKLQQKVECQDEVSK